MLIFFRILYFDCSITNKILLKDIGFRLSAISISFFYKRVNLEREISNPILRHAPTSSEFEDTIYFPKNADLCS